MDWTVGRSLTVGFAIPDTPSTLSSALFKGLTEAETAHVLGRGERKVLYRGAQLFRQGSPQDGIHLIESGRIKVFYIAPSGREITLAYWHSGNFVGGPEVFKQGLHVWSGSAAVNSTVLHLPGDILREMVLTIPAFAVGIIEGLRSRRPTSAWNFLPFFGGFSRK